MKCGGERDLENNPRVRESERRPYGTDTCRTEVIRVRGDGGDKRENARFNHPGLGNGI